MFRKSLAALLVCAVPAAASAAEIPGDLSVQDVKVNCTSGAYSFTVVNHGSVDIKELKWLANLGDSRGVAIEYHASRTGENEALHAGQQLRFTRHVPRMTLSECHRVWRPSVQIERAVPAEGLASPQT